MMITETLKERIAQAEQNIVDVPIGSEINYDADKGIVLTDTPAYKASHQHKYRWFNEDGKNVLSCRCRCEPPKESAGIEIVNKQILDNADAITDDPEEQSEQEKQSAELFVSLDKMSANLTAAAANIRGCYEMIMGITTDYRRNKNDTCC